MTDPRYTFPAIREYREVAFDSEGFYPRECREEIVKWNEVVQVAYGYWIHSIAIVDFNFWAFRLLDNRQSVWVEEGYSKNFEKEISVRYDIPEDIPFDTEWEDSEMCIRTYTVWPKNVIGKPLYLTKKRHWWSFSGALAFDISEAEQAHQADG